MAVSKRNGIPACKQLTIAVGAPHLQDQRIGNPQTIMSMSLTAGEVAFLIARLRPPQDGLSSLA
jgi:hypothetical protein